VNGKIDTAALPDPKEAAQEREAFVGAENQHEVILTEVWEDILGVEEISVTQNFFELGGDSIKAIQIVSRLQSHNLRMDVQ
ncbi:phosphopantetheine-binding protein, partial [Bacillus cereus]